MGVMNHIRMLFGVPPVEDNNETIFLRFIDGEEVWVTQSYIKCENDWFESEKKKYLGGVLTDQELQEAVNEVLKERSVFFKEHTILIRRKKDNKYVYKPRGCPKRGLDYWNR